MQFSDSTLYHLEAGVDIDFSGCVPSRSRTRFCIASSGTVQSGRRSAMGHTFVFSLAAEKRNPFGSMADSNNARLNLPEDSDWFAPSTMKAYFCLIV